MIIFPNSIFTQTKVKQPSIIKTIRINDGIKNAWWLNSDYYSLNFEDKRYIYTFLTRESADNCICLLKKIYNKDFYVDEEPNHLMKKRCMLNNVGLIGVTDFNYTCVNSFFDENYIYTLNISCIDLLAGQKLDIDEYVDNLNFLLDF